MATRMSLSLLVLAGLVACGGPSEEDLLELPFQVAEDLRGERYDDALKHLSKDFQYSGMGVQEIALWLPRVRDMSEWNPYILKVEILPSQEETHRLLILGAYCRGSAPEITPARIRPFKAVASIGVIDGRFSILSIEYDE